MSDMLRVDKVDYDDVAEGVRRFCAERLYELEKTLRPLVDNTFGEVLPGHLAGYLALIRQLGGLYQTHKPPRELQNTVPMTKVQELLARMEVAKELEIQAAVAAAEARVRSELESGSKRSVLQAQATVSAKLLELEARSSG